MKPKILTAYFIIITILLSTLTSCIGNQNKTVSQTENAMNSVKTEVPSAPEYRFESLKAVDFSKQIAAFQNKEDFLLLDVRTLAEHTEAHIANDLLIPVQELGNRIDEIAGYKNKPVYLYCRSGNRSRTAAEILIKAGFTEIYDLAGGIGGWVAVGLPTVKE